MSPSPPLLSCPSSCHGRRDTVPTRAHLGARLSVVGLGNSFLE